MAAAPRIPSCAVSRLALWPGWQPYRRACHGKTPCFDRADFVLLPARYEVWESFVFVNTDGKAGALSSRLASQAEALNEFGFSRWRTVKSRDYGICPRDWKIFQDNGEQYVDTFNAEDTEVCKQVQRGLESSAATSGPLSRLEGHNRDTALWVAQVLTPWRVFLVFCGLDRSPKRGLPRFDLWLGFFTLTARRQVYDSESGRMA
jgi:hypothetical protein